MSFQTCKTFIHLQNTNEDIFWWNPRDFWPSIDSNTTDTFKAQKCSKDIIKIVHVHQWFNLNFTKLWEYFVCKENKNNDFIQQFLLFRVSLGRAFTTVPQHIMNIIFLVEVVSDALIYKTSKL